MHGPLEVFHQVDLLIEQVKKIALVGPNGAGKSTLLRILIARNPPHQGSDNRSQRAAGLFCTGPGQSIG